MTAPVTVTSLIAPNALVTYDQWSLNPLLDDAMQTAGATVALARQTNGEPPTMWVTGDLPPFTASGMDTRFLRVMPWRIRHAAAANPDMGDVLSWVERYAYDPDVTMPSDGMTAYIGRFRDWLGGKWTNPNFTGADPAATAAAEDVMFGQLFGAQSDGISRRIASLAVNNPPRPSTYEAQQAARAAQQPGRAQR